MKNFITLLVILLIATFGVYLIDKFVSSNISNLSDIQKLVEGLKF